MTIIRIWHNEDRNHFFGYEYGNRLVEVFAYRGDERTSDLSLCGMMDPNAKRNEDDRCLNCNKTWERCWELRQCSKESKCCTECAHPEYLIDVNERA